MQDWPCCTWEEKREVSEWLKVISDILPNLLWRIRRDVDGIEKQEELALKILKHIGSMWSMDKIVEWLLEIEKKLKLQKYKEEKKEEEMEAEEGSSLYSMFEDGPEEE